MKLNELSTQERQELEVWARQTAAQFEQGIEATPGATIPPLMEIRRLRFQRRKIDEATSQLVQTARDQGDSWQRIGMALGTTAEAARQRYRQPV